MFRFLHPLNNANKPDFQFLVLREAIQQSVENDRGDPIEISIRLIPAFNRKIRKASAETLKIITQDCLCKDKGALPTRKQYFCRLL